MHCVPTLTYTGIVASQSHIPNHLIFSGNFRPVITMYNVSSCWGKTCLSFCLLPLYCLVVIKKTVIFHNHYMGMWMLL